MATPNTPTTAPVAVAAPAPVVDDKSTWEYVEVPEYDLFDKPFGNIQINFVPYGPGKHFVNPELAGEMRRLLKNRQQGDVRILRPTQDAKMKEIMARNGKAVPTDIDVSGMTAR